VFVLMWMLLPPILVLVGSYLIRPAFVERYMLSSFVPFFLLVAFGILSIRGLVAQYSLLALVALLSVGHIYSSRLRPHDVQWREAVNSARTASSRKLGVAPPYAAEVVRYYLRDSHQQWLVLPGRAEPPGVAIVASSGVPAAEAESIANICPHLLAHWRGVIVRGP
jgi:hypothetical protein